MSIARLNDYEEILTVINQYLEGGNISGEEAKKAFHPNATVNAEPAQVLFDVIDEAAPGKSVARADILDVVEDIACARIVMEICNGKNYIDFLHLLKTDDGWKIVSKVYTEF